MNNPSIWITWEKQIRNISMSTRLHASYYPVIFEGNFFLRYIYCVYKTVKLLVKNRDKTVFVQNPSIVLAFIAVVLKRLLRYKLVVDAHNSGVFPKKSLQWLANFINKNANFVIVTNIGLADFITSLGGNPIILPDPLPNIHVDPQLKSIWGDVPDRSVMAICSWASDEPYVEIITAAEEMPDVTFYITGNSKGRERNYPLPLPSNVVLTGYLSENDYHVLLMNSAVILDLTIRDDCLVCGAYEAIAVGKPLVLSDTPALRSYFGYEATFVNNEAGSIAKGIFSVFAAYDELFEKAKDNSSKVEERWGSLFDVFKRMVFNN